MTQSTLLLRFFLLSADWELENGDRWSRAVFDSLWLAQLPEEP